MDREQILASLRERIVAFAASRIARDVAEDLAQEVLVLLHEKYSHVTRIEELLPLSFQIVRFKMVSLRRKAARRGEYTQVSVEDIHLPDPGDDPGAQLERRQMSERLTAAIGKLDGKCREMFRLKLEGKTFAEIQTLMEAASINTVYTWDARCRKRLLELMEEIGRAVMTDENIQNLLGGFATGTLSDQERGLLFSAALKDQELFNALADEEVLREFLSDPAARRRLLGLLQPETPGIFDRLASWMRRPATWAVAGAAMAVLVVAVVMRESRPRAVDMAMTRAPEVAPAVQPPAAAPREVETRALSRRDAKKEAPAQSKMKVAVLEFDSGPALAKEADSKSADLGKTASDLLGKKLDMAGYDIIDRKQVVKEMQAQKLNERQMNPAAAASLGRRLGADAVIMGSVKPSVVMNLVDTQTAAPRSEPPGARAKAVSETVQVSATAIDTQNAVSLAYAQGSQTTTVGLAGSVDQVASSLGQQIQQNARLKIEGLVTDVNAKIVTVNVGALAGVKVGDRLEIRRAGKPVGRVVINSVQESFSVGMFEGVDSVKAGDAVANQ